MIDFPKNIMEFTKRFADDRACWDYLVKTRWPDGVFRNGEDPIGYVSTRGLWTFRDGFQQSATSGTVMHGTRTPLSKWFWAAYLLTTHTPGISARQLARQIDLRYETAYMMLQKLRAGLVNPYREKLHGTVEIDESYVGGRGTGKRGRGSVTKSLVIGAVEIIDTSKKQIGGRLRLRQISSAKSETIEKFILEHVERRSIVLTDGLQSYNDIERFGYKHKVLVGEDSVEVAKQLVHIHRAFSNLKTWLNGSHHGVSKKHLQAYLNEFVFRYNRRGIPFEAFKSALGIATRNESPEYKELYHAGEDNGWKHPNPKG